MSHILDVKRVDGRKYLVVADGATPTYLLAEDESGCFSVRESLRDDVLSAPSAMIRVGDLRLRNHE